jgi:hypothetical protein
MEQLVDELQTVDKDKVMSVKDHVEEIKSILSAILSKRKRRIPS